MAAAGADGIGHAALNGFGPPTGNKQFGCQSEDLFTGRGMEMVKVMTLTHCVKHFKDFLF